ncbi:MAG TPA: hypothetical protein VFO19_17695 [Vicinamibacterales bacterium]|nr:hypothetical protein [Vicinamibacterales bacterium]
MAWISKLDPKVIGVGLEGNVVEVDRAGATSMNWIQKVRLNVEPAYEFSLEKTDGHFVQAFTTFLMADLTTSKKFDLGFGGGPLVAINTPAESTVVNLGLVARVTAPSTGRFAIRAAYLLIVPGFDADVFGKEKRPEHSYMIGLVYRYNQR